MWQMNDFIISTDKSLLEFDVIHRFISKDSYWGLGRSKELMEKAINGSAYCFGLYCHKYGARNQIGFARVISDLATFGYLADGFVLEDYRGKGLGKWLIQTIVNHPELKKLRRLTLHSRTPDFYYDAGFVIYDPKSVAKFMELKLN
jgi:N-acetylglutamate synthase-like GNAT family acetyltransferase